MLKRNQKRVRKRRSTTNEKEQDQRLYQIDDVQVLLSIGRTKAYELVTTGELPMIKIGRSIRVRKADLERFIEENRY